MPEDELSDIWRQVCTDPASSLRRTGEPSFSLVDEYAAGRAHHRLVAAAVAAGADDGRSLPYFDAADCAAAERTDADHCLADRCVGRSPGAAAGRSLECLGDATTGKNDCRVG